MTMKSAKNKDLPIGLDIGTGAVKMAQLRRTEDGLALIEAAAVAIPHELRGNLSSRLDFIGQNIRDMLKTCNFRNRQCVFSIPAAETFVQHVKIPKLPAGEIEPAVRNELEGKLPYPIKQMITRHIIAGDLYGEGDPKQEIVVIAVAKDVMDAYLDMARYSRLDIIGVNIESCAVLECFARLFRRTADTARTILFLDMGASSTQVVLSHGNHLAFARNLQIGGDKLDEAVANGLKVSVDQASAMRSDLAKGGKNPQAENELYHLLDKPLDSLTNELTQCLRYYESVFRNQHVERAIFVGGQAHDKRFCQTLAQRLNLPAQVGDPLALVERVNGAGISIGLDRREPQPNWAVAVGLSLGANTAA